MIEEVEYEDRPSPWNGISFLVLGPFMVLVGAIIGLFWGAWKGLDLAWFNTYHRKHGEWAFKKPSQ